MATFLICHGAWSAGWAWKKVRPLLRAAGHEVFTPTYTGLGERAHHASPAVDLETHIADVLAVIEFEDLERHHAGRAQLRRHGRDRRCRPRARAHQAADLSRRLRAGERAEPARPAAARAAAGAGAEAASEDWLIAPNPPPPDTSAADLAWITPQASAAAGQDLLPAAAFAQSASPTFPRSYIYCTRKAPDDVFLQFSKRFKSDPGLALLRDRRQPQPQRDGAGGTGALAVRDRGLAALRPREGTTAQERL